MSASGPTSGWNSSRGVKSVWAPIRAPARRTWLISRSSSDTACDPLPSRAMARRASRKLSTESAICSPNTLSSVSVIRLISFRRTLVRA